MSQQRLVFSSLILMSGTRVCITAHGSTYLFIRYTRSHTHTPHTRKHTHTHTHVYIYRRWIHLAMRQRRSALLSWRRAHTLSIYVMRTHSRYLAIATMAECFAELEEKSFFIQTALISVLPSLPLSVLFPSLPLHCLFLLLRPPRPCDRLLSLVACNVGGGGPLFLGRGGGNFRLSVPLGLGLHLGSACIFVYLFLLCDSPSPSNRSLLTTNCRPSL